MKKKDWNNDNINKDDIRNFWINLANHHDTILQSYRTIFITSETILISFAALLYPLEITLIKLILIGALFFTGLYIIKKWYKLTWDRGIWVFYCNTQAMKLDNCILEEKAKEKPYLTFLEWKDSSKWDAEKKLLEIDRDRTKSGLDQISKEYARNFLGIKLPKIYQYLWLIILIVNITPDNFLKNFISWFTRLL